MNFIKQVLSLLPVAALAFSMNAHADSSIVNIDASKYGYNSQAGAVVGDSYQLTDYDNTGTGSYSLLTVTLAAGDYTWSNAAGLAGATYNDYSFRKGDSSWAWDFAVFDASTGELVFSGGIAQQTSDAAAEALSAGLSGTFSLSEATTLVFAVQDYRMGDNVGGVSLLISTVPEPETYAMMLAGLGLLGFAARRRNS